MAFSSSTTIKPLHQNQLPPFTLCKCPSNFNFSYDIFTFSPKVQKVFPTFLEVRAHVSHSETNLSTREEVDSKGSSVGEGISDENNGFSSFRPREVLEENVVEGSGKNRDFRHKGGHSRNRVGSGMSKGEKFAKGLSKIEESAVAKAIVQRTSDKSNGFSSIRPKEVMESNMVEGDDKYEVLKLKEVIDKGLSSVKAEGEKFAKSSSESEGSVVISEKDEGRKLGVVKRGKRYKKKKNESREAKLRVALDRCSKRGHVLGAIRIYDLAKREGVKLGQYHYAIILYLCASAATGFVQPAKSGKENRSKSIVEFSRDSYQHSHDTGQLDRRGFASTSGSTDIRSFTMHSSVAAWDDVSNGSISEEDGLNSSHGSKQIGYQTLDEFIHLIVSKEESLITRKVSDDQENFGIRVDEGLKEYALKRGFEIYDEMLMEKVPLNESTLTSLARMATSMGDGDMAFNMVKQMKDLGITPRLRSYGPALSVFCDSGDIEKAFIVEEHMLAHDVHPEEPELEALLRVSIEASRSDKVYYLLHKLRTSVRRVKPSTADVIEKWFTSKVASRVGKRKLDQRLVKEAIENGGGGWHGLGWLGKGKWTVTRTFVGADGLCKCCGEKLVTIDLDPMETEKFAESVARIAKEREKDSSFEKFQKWLEYYGPFEAVVDGANVGLFSQRKLKPSKINAIVSGLRHMLPSKKSPLIVLHNKRLTGDKMDEGTNKMLFEKWKNADALYATPTGSNDDWYWLYAAIKCKCLLVTNDEMRDHLFQLLGNDFFPKWKERHQVRFRFSEIGPVFHMPPPCSVVIQESEKGHWHVPVVSKDDSEEERTWLCITRSPTSKASQDSITIEEPRVIRYKKGRKDSSSETMVQPKQLISRDGDQENLDQPSQEIYLQLDTVSSPERINHAAILPQIEAAEKLGSCLIDFQI